MKTKTYKINGMDCTSCASMIELDLEDAGIKSKCSFVKQTLEVETDEKNNIDQKVRKIIESAGYTIAS